MTRARPNGGESRPLIRAVRRALRERADARKAESMQAYMKSAMPFLGVQAGPLRAACREVFAEHPLDGADEWRATTLALWREAAFREERYAAVELTGFPPYRSFQTMEALPMYEEMIVGGAWWDFVDWIASHRLGELLRRHPAPMRRHMRAWAKSSDLWKRRSAILCQLRFKGDTDLELLYECIGRAAGDADFFLRKAIGWALREYAKTDPREVRRYVAANAERLSALSRREALRNIG